MGSQQASEKDLHDDVEQHEKEKDKGEQQKEPGDARMSVFTNEIQNPCPEQNIDELQEKNQCGIDNIGSITS